MAMPALLTLNATSSAVWTPDWMENPFVVGIQAVTNTSGVNGTAIIEASMNFGMVQTATFFTVVPVTGASTTANFTTPVQAFRASIVTATATSSWGIVFVQATTPP